LCGERWILLGELTVAKLGFKLASETALPLTIAFKAAKD
jgi:hypothetical protein